ncbi:hypothetical protein H0H93_013877, partial [Arthromyces matolae]
EKSALDASHRRINALSAPVERKNKGPHHKPKPNASIIDGFKKQSQRGPPALKASTASSHSSSASAKSKSKSKAFLSHKPSQQKLPDSPGPQFNPMTRSAQVPYSPHIPHTSTPLSIRSKRPHISGSPCSSTDPHTQPSKPELLHLPKITNSTDDHADIAVLSHPPLSNALYSPAKPRGSSTDGPVGQLGSFNHSNPGLPRSELDNFQDGVEMTHETPDMDTLEAQNTLLSASASRPLLFSSPPQSNNRSFAPDSSSVLRSRFRPVAMSSPPRPTQNTGFEGVVRPRPPFPYDTRLNAPFMPELYNQYAHKLKP